MRIVFIGIFLFVLGANCAPQRKTGFGHGEYRLTVRGFLLGIGVRHLYVDQLIELIQESSRGEKDFITEFNKIEEADLSNYALVSSLFTYVFMNLIKTISEIHRYAPENAEYGTLFDFLKGVQAPILEKELMTYLLEGSQNIIKAMNSSVQRFRENQYARSGMALGEMLKNSYLSNMKVTTLTLEEYKRVMNGTLKGLEIFNFSTEIIGCVKSVPYSFADTVTAMSEVKYNNLAHLEEILKSVLTIRESVKKMLLALGPCGGSYEQVHKMIKKLEIVDMEEMYKITTLEAKYFFQFYIGARDAWKDQDIQAYGGLIGSIVRVSFSSYNDTDAIDENSHKDL